MPDSTAEPAILLEMARRMRHHAKDVGVAVLGQQFAGAIIVLCGVAVGNARHIPPWVSGSAVKFRSTNEYRRRDATATRPSQIAAVLLFDLGTVDIRRLGTR
jgi:hypothetical protein